MPARKIRIRSYNVGFGDCFLVTLPDGAKTRSILIDFGNAPGKAGSNANFPSFARDIRDETGGHLDAVVVTHEHLDHMEGFRSQKKIFDKMTIDWVWMSLPSHPAYYEDFPAARPQKKLRALAEEYERSLAARKIALAPSFAALLRNNLSNVDRMNYLRDLPAKKVLYLRRGSSVRNKPFTKDVKISVLAPEKDMSVYYGRGHGPHLSGLTRSLNAAATGRTREKGWWDFPPVQRVEVPPNLSAGDWQRLHGTIQGGGVEAVRAIDKAANNTSLVFVVEVHGKRLLFTGDAELESWEVLKKRAGSRLKPVDFMKVSHHGSHNGTPDDLLDTLLPKSRKAKATVLVSTRSKVYGTVNPVPDKSLLTELKKRCRTLVSTDDTNKLWVDVHL